MATSYEKWVKHRNPIEKDTKRWKAWNWIENECQTIEQFQGLGKYLDEKYESTKGTLDYSLTINDIVKNTPKP